MALVVAPAPAFAGTILWDGGLVGHLSAPTNVNGFEAAGTPTLSPGTPYVEDGVAIAWVPLGWSGTVATQEYVHDGAYGWQGSGYGYASIRLTNHAVIDEIQWQSYLCCNMRIDFQLWNDGTLVEANHFGGGGSVWRNYGIETSGSIFNEVRLQYSVDGAAFDPTTYAGFNIDQIEIRTSHPPSTSPVPEPATWAIMILGLGLVGATTRRRKPVAA